jgi:hypothetical protein
MLKTKCCSITLVGADIITRFLATKNVTVGTTAVNSCPSNAGRKALSWRAPISGNGRWVVRKRGSKENGNAFCRRRSKATPVSTCICSISLMIPYTVASQLQSTINKYSLEFNSERVKSSVSRSRGLKHGLQFSSPCRCGRYPRK